MQTRLDALQELKDEVATAERFIADMDQRVLSARHLTAHHLGLPWRESAKPQSSQESITDVDCNRRLQRESVNVDSGR